MRRKAGGLRPIHLGCAFFLALPPLVHLGEFVWILAQSDAGADAPVETDATDPGLAAEAAAVAAADLPVQLASARRRVAVLEEELYQAQQELRAVGAATLPGRYRTSLADVIPVSDPIGGRALLWVALRDPDAVTQSGAAFWDERLVGRVVERYDRPAVAKVQLLQDPDFRVRFRAGDLTGILQGQAQLSEGGDPLLAVRFVSSAEGLTAGTDVFTAGDDGIYPPGLWIGRLEETHRGTDTDTTGFVVCALEFPRVWSKVRLAVDVTARSVDSLAKQAES